MSKRRLSDISPLFYNLAVQKEIVKRKVKDILSKDKFAKNKFENKKLDNIVYKYDSYLIKEAPGIDIQLQKNKVDNIIIAAKSISGIVIHPGEVFSFWRIVGKATKRKGYKKGRVIVKGKLTSSIGGGLCNIANTMNILIQHSPLEVVEFNKHSDALAPDEGERVPLTAGTSIFYNYVDYRFKNNTDQDVQLIMWCKDDRLYAELRSERKFKYNYELSEEDHCFQKEGDKYYRKSRIYKNTINNGEVINKELIWDNHSLVMFDYDLIPKEQIKA